MRGIDEPRPSSGGRCRERLSPPELWLAEGQQTVAQRVKSLEDVIDHWHRLTINRGARLDAIEDRLDHLEAADHPEVGASSALARLAAVEADLDRVLALLRRPAAGP